MHKVHPSRVPLSLYEAHKNSACGNEMVQRQMNTSVPWSRDEEHTHFGRFMMIHVPTATNSDYGMDDTTFIPSTKPYKGAIANFPQQFVKGASSLLRRVQIGQNVRARKKQEEEKKKQEEAERKAREVGGCWRSYFCRAL